MTKRPPGASARIAERLRAHRTAGGWDQAAVAALLTAAGLPTNTATIVRIENGDQPPTVEQALLLAVLVMPNGLRTLLEPPFTLGNLTVRKVDDLGQVLGHEIGPRTIPDTPMAREATRLVSKTLAEARDSQIAGTLNVSRELIAEAAEALYGKSAASEASERFSARLDQLHTRPEVESASWRAYRSHAVRAVAAEIHDYLKGSK